MIQDAKTFTYGLETAFGVPVATDHALEILGSSKFTWNPNRVQGAGMRVGATFPRSARRTEVSAAGAGNLDVEALSKGQGLLWKAVMGAGTPTLVSTGVYQNLFTRTTTVLPSLTIQKAIQTMDGTVRPETYFGCTCTDWELSFDNSGLIKLSSNWDAKDMVVAQSATATTLSSAATAGATTISVAATIAAGTVIVINALEVARVVSVSGSGPYTLSLLTPLQNAYSSGVAVSIPGAYNAPSYPSAANLYSFAGATLYTGTVTAPTATALASALTPIATVRSGSISVNNTVLDSRYLAGGGGRKAQQRMGAPVGTVKLSAEYWDTSLRDAFLADTPMTLVANFTAGALTTGMETIQAIVSEMKPNADMPDADGTDVPLLDLEYTILDNLTAAQPMWIVQRTAESTL